MTGVYAIGTSEEGPIKVGITSNQKTRLADLQVASPVELFILGWWHCNDDDARLIEESTHCLLKDLRLRGEWFDADIAKVRRAVEEAINRTGTDTLEKLQNDILLIAGIVGDQELSYEERLLRIFKIVTL